jgi:antibiotic biosynthesis monooxygenase (ABM) superfamily enzyme
MIFFYVTSHIHHGCSHRWFVFPGNPEHPSPHSPAYKGTNVIIVIVKIIATSQNLLHEIYLNQIQFFQYLVIFVLPLVTNI